MRRPIGLALSGGGFRAMLFHAGGLVRLNELGLLGALDEIGGVSGGALVAGRLAAAWHRLAFVGGRAANLWEEVIHPLVEFAGRRLDVTAVASALLPGISAAGVATRHYLDLTGGLALGDLPRRPRFSFLAVHLASGSPWWFDHEGGHAPRIGQLRDTSISLAAAMAASAAYPPFLAPLWLRCDRSLLEPTPGADLTWQVGRDGRLALADGGIHDNLGLEPIWDRCATILSSDAGGVLEPAPRAHGLWLRQLIRTLAIHADRGRALRRHAVLEALRRGERHGTLWRIDVDPHRYPARPAVPVHPAWPRELATVRTRLDRFTPTERRRLVNWGYVVADVALRSHVVDGEVPTSLPFVGFGFAKSPTRAIMAEAGSSRLPDIESGHAAVPRRTG
jgi:NTE family protein